MTEEWKDHPTFDVQCSTWGRVIRNYAPYQFLPTYGSTNGIGSKYYCVKVRQKKHRVHRLIAQTFIHNDDPDRKIFVNHIDNNGMNNRIENLEWCTPLENVTHYNSLDKTTYLRSPKMSIDFFLR